MSLRTSASQSSSKKYLFVTFITCWNVALEVIWGEWEKASLLCHRRGGNTTHNAWTTSSADFTWYCFGIQAYPYFCESLCHLWSELQMKLTRNFYYSKNSEVIVWTTDHWSWQDRAPRGAQGSTALVVLFFFPFPDSRKGTPTPLQLSHPIFSSKNSDPIISICCEKHS